jgi:adenylylsulfate kinase
VLIGEIVMSWAIWITGIPGSGKSTLAHAAGEELRARGYPVRILELDQIRKTLTPEPRDTDTERDVVYRALGWMARLLTEAGVSVIVGATAHRRAWRDLARAAISRFAEAQIACPPDLARKRENIRSGDNAPRGIHERAGQPGATVPGLDVMYEPALAPELVIDTARESVAEAAHRIADLAVLLAAGTEEPAFSTAGWAIWITGRPGTGKTTVASRVVEALATRAVPVRVLDLDEARRHLVPGRRPSEAEREILHRALAYATKLLTEAGTAVIVDAAAPRRDWRQTARELVPCFAEVYLVCPAAVCVNRERAARWGLGGKAPAFPPPTGGDAAPDIILDYEESFRPELIVHTDVDDPSTAAQKILFLVQRLHRSLATPLNTP